MIYNISILILYIFDNCHKKKIFSFLKKKIKKIDVFIDVGGHKGETVFFVLKNFLVKNIFSFEPSKYNFYYLQKNIKDYIKKFIYTNIEVFNFGLGDKEQKISFNQTSESSSSTINKINTSSRYFQKKNIFLKKKNQKYIIKKYKIKVSTLDKFIYSYKIKIIDLIKIDTEGYEFYVLKGLKKNFRIVKYIYLEHHYDNMLVKKYSFSDINNILKKFHFKKIFKIKMPFRNTFEYIYENQRIK
jgi:FkbM family methyltransferase